MMANIINKERLEDHTIQRYRFKVIGSPPTMLNAEESQYDGPVQELEEEAPVFVKQAVASEESHHHQLLVEELLKKTDELTTHVVKLQIQIEKQEGEFSQRLHEEIKREHDNALQEGYQKAKEELESVLMETKSRYFKSIQQLENFSQMVDEKLARFESEMSTTAFEIAKEVIKKELSHSSAAIAKELSKELLKELKEATFVEIRTNPKDFEALQMHYSGHEKVKVISDDAITLGGVVLLSDVGNLDGSLAMRLEKVKYLIQENEA